MVLLLPRDVSTRWTSSGWSPYHVTLIDNQSIGVDVDDMGYPPRWAVAEKALGVGALGMAFGAFAGHLMAPDQVADHYGWVRDRWYQRELGAFNAGLGVGIIAYARGHREAAFLGSWSAAALLLALTRLAAMRAGDRRGMSNLATIAEDAALGLGGAVLAVRSARTTNATA